MADLIAVGFEGKHRAAEVLGQLQELDDSSTIDLRDAVAVYRARNGKLRIDQSLSGTTKEEAAWGGLLGAIIGGVLAAPFALAASVPAAAVALGIGGTALGATGGAVVAFDDASTWKEKYGISDEFVGEVGGMVQPGESAVFVLARVSNPAFVAERFRGYGGRVLRTTLSRDSTTKLQETLARPHDSR